MPTDSEFSESFNQIEDFISQVGDSVDEVHEGTLDEEDEKIEYKIINATDASYNCYYGVFGRADQELFTLQYRYDLLSSLSEYIQTPEGKEFFESDEFSSMDSREAAKTVINRVSSEDLNRLEFQLYDYISNPLTVSDVAETDEGGIQGFSVYRHLLPFEDEFSLYNFYNSLVAVISTGEKGHRYLSNSFAIRVPEKESEEYSMSFDPDDLFRDR
jgi:hypothetical protein